MGIGRKETWERYHIILQVYGDPLLMVPTLQAFGMDVEGVLVPEKIIAGNVAHDVDADVISKMPGVVDVKVDDHTHAMIDLAKSRAMAPGTRVRVLSGDRSAVLGDGEYLGDVDVHVIQLADGSLGSMANAEQEPQPQDVPAGASVRKVAGNPKIRLDDGRIVYGCQVWFGPVSEFEKRERARKDAVKGVAASAAADALRRM